MGNIIESILDRLKLTEEEDYEDDYEEETPIVRRRESSLRTEKFDTATAATREQNVSQVAPRRFEAKPVRPTQVKSSYEEPEEIPEPQPRRVTRPERQPVPMRSAAASGLELMLRQPESFDDSQEICDLLKQERVVILNLENLDRETAQKMMDFISGAIYALDSKIHQISNSVFCISPSKVDISGDYFAMISETAGFKIPDVLNK